MLCKKLALVAFASACATLSATAQVPISSGNTVSENFTTLSTNAVATLPTGWKVDKNATAVRTVGTYSAAVTATERAGGVSLSSSASSGIYNFGSSATDRAVGGLSASSAAKSVNLYVALQNTGGSSIPSFTVSYNAERYRNGSNAAGFSIQLYYSTDGTTWTSAGANFLSSFAANADNSGSATVPMQTIAVTTQSLPVALPAGSTLYLAWNYSVTSGTTTSNAQAIGVSDISITAASVTPGAPVISSPLTASAVAFATSSNVYQITASGSPTSFGASGLPEGLTVDTATGIISGQPTVPGTYPVIVTATNTLGTGQETVSLTVTKNPGAPTITSSLAVTTPVSSPFSYQIEASNSPTSYAASNLPTGLTIDPATGAISGTPTTSGVRSIGITASNSLGSDTQTLVLTVSSVPVITSSLSGSLYTTNTFSYTITATGTPTPTLDATGLPAGWTIVNGVVSNGGSPLTTGTVSFQISASNSVGTDTETYTLAVFDQTTQNAIPLNVVVNKYANATPDRVQLLVVGSGTAGSSADLRGMILKDFSDSNAADNGGKFVFASNALWSSVPAGTLVALSAGTSQTEDFDASDYTLAVNLGNPIYFSDGGGTFNLGTTEMVMIKSAGSGVSGVAGGIHTLATGGATPGAQFAAFLGAKLRTPQTSGTDQGLIANNTTSTIVDYGVSGLAASTDATGAVAITALDFLSWNNNFNETYILSLRGSAPQNPYNTWASGFGLDPAITTGPTAGAPTADPDSDGFNNQQEYAFGTNPTQGTPSLLSTESSGGNLIVRWLERAGVTYNVQSTANLATTAFANDGTISVVAGPIDPAPPAGYTRKQFSVPATGNKFYRVSGATAAP